MIDLVKAVNWSFILTLKENDPLSFSTIIIHDENDCHQISLQPLKNVNVNKVETVEPFVICVLMLTHSFFSQIAKIGICYENEE
jgi:hypothetical protein